jgi:hypothetical protein
MKMKFQNSHVRKLNGDLMESKPCHYCKTFEEEVISPLREIVQRQPTKKGLIYLVDKFQFIFVAKVP